MKLEVLCTNREHPVLFHLRRWVVEMGRNGHDAAVRLDRSELTGGDILFLVSCSQIIRKQEREGYGSVLVLHASDLPHGRGMSPHVWAILAGAGEIHVCLLEAEDRIDTGRIWARTRFQLEGHELLDEINDKLFAAELALMTRAVANASGIQPEPQPNIEVPLLPKRTPLDSRLDPAKSLADQFDLMRVVDNARYPLFFEHRGHRYVLKIEKEVP